MRHAMEPARDGQHEGHPAPARGTASLPVDARAAVGGPGRCGSSATGWSSGISTSRTRRSCSTTRRSTSPSSRTRGRPRHPDGARPQDDRRRRPRRRRQVPAGRVPAVLRPLGPPAHEPDRAGGAVFGSAGDALARAVRAETGGAVRGDGGVPARPPAGARPEPRHARRDRRDDAPGPGGRARRRARRPPRDVAAHAAASVPSLRRREPEVGAAALPAARGRRADRRGPRRRLGGDRAGAGLLRPGALHPRLQGADRRLAGAVRRGPHSVPKIRSPASPRPGRM